MKMGKIKKMAKSLGLTTSPEIKKAEVIKAIQRKEGNFECLFKKDCLVLTT